MLLIKRERYQRILKKFKPFTNNNSYFFEVEKHTINRRQKRRKNATMITGRKVINQFSVSAKNSVFIRKLIEKFLTDIL